MIEKIETKERIIEKMFSTSNPTDRCPYLRKDEVSPYCGRDLKNGDEIVEGRRSVCGVVSLQLQCFDKKRYPHCDWYKGKPF